MQGNPTIKKVGDIQIDLKCQLGDGSFGIVYKGKDSMTNSDVAVKVVSKNLINSEEYYKVLMSNEVRVMQQLRSPNVVRMIDAIESTNNYYIVTEFCDGGDLRTLMLKRDKFPEPEAIKIIVDLLKGYEELLERGIIHRDIKPENVLIHKGIYKLGDFGFAKSLKNHKKDMLTSNIGTPMYMSPQLLRGQSYTSKADIWSFAVLLYELVFGFPPFGHKSKQSILKNIEIFKDVPFPSSNLSKNMIDFLKKTIKIEESERSDWYDVYLHPVFNDQFKYKFTVKQTLLDKRYQELVGELRRRLNDKKVDIDKFYDAMDINKDAILDFKEFTNLLLMIDKELTREEIEYIFNKCDVKNRNEITFNVFKQIFKENEERRFIDILKEEDESKKVPEETSTTENIKLLNSFVKERGYEVLDLFRQFDADKNLRLDKKEFYKFMKKVDEESGCLHLSDKAIEELFNYFDINGDGFVNKIEFLDKLQEKSSPSRRPRNFTDIIEKPESNEKKKSNERMENLLNRITRFLQSFKEVENIFEAFDINKTGFLRLHEFVNFVHLINPEYKEAEIFAAFASLDRDYDDQISLKEFELLIASKEGVSVELIEKRNGRASEEFRRSMEASNPGKDLLIYSKYNEFKRVNTLLV